MTGMKWMKRALQLAEQGRGHVEPNPLVGAVIVRDDEIVGEGWHRKFGEAHAEINALEAASESARGSTMYVTLEPCCHFGKTPPCTDAIIRAGISRVVAAFEDPFPQVAGKGKEQLRAAGIDIEFGVCGPEARRQNAPYLKLQSTGRPYVHAKWAMTLDGKIATRSGDSKWISNKASRRRVHKLRGCMDAIVVGAGTVLADDPLLTARPPGPRKAVRIVLDSKGTTPVSSQLVQTAADVPTLIAGTSALIEKRNEFEHAGCEILDLAGEDARPGINNLLDQLGERRMTNILIEGGSEVLGSFVDADAVDEYHVFIAPRIAGGRDAKSPAGGKGINKMADALQLERWEVEMIEDDIYLHAQRAGSR